jgi:uncharacterized repeat protein (TIGR01451 family)
LWYRQAPMKSGLLIRFGLLIMIFAGSLRGQAGSLDHFGLDPLPESVQTDQSFAGKVTARDINNLVVTNHNGAAILTEYSAALPPGVLISEVETITTRRVELFNSSASTVDIGNWRIVFYDRLSWPAPKCSFTVPDGTGCVSRGIFEVRSGGFFPGAFPIFFTGVSLAWTSQSSNNQIAVLLLDASGNVRDFFCAFDGYPNLINIPVSGAAIWNGLPTGPNANSTLTYQRGGQLDHDDATDWILAANSIGALNSALRLPFVGKSFRTPAVPSSVSVTNGIWNGTIALTVPGTNVWLRADDGVGHSGDSTFLNVSAKLALNLEIPGAASKATPGLAGQGIVTIPFLLSTNLMVTLSNTLPNQFVIPTAVNLPAGLSNVSFTITNLDNGLLEGPQVAAIFASAAGFSTATDVITNFDRDTPTLTFSTVNPVLETAGWFGTAQVRVSVPAAANVTVQLTSDSPSRLMVQDFVTIPAGLSAASFGISVLDNRLTDGDKLVTLQATVPGWISGQRQILVRDNEGTNLVLLLPSFNIVEGRGVLTNAGTVQITSPLLTDLTVNLSSSVPGKFQVPATVIISSGQTSKVFNVTLPDDSVPETNQPVSITATANGYASVVRNLTVRDNDAFSFSIDPLPHAQIVGGPFALAVYAMNASGNVAQGYSGSVNIHADGTTGAMLMSPTVLAPFVDGLWSGFVTVGTANPNTVLTVNDGLGHAGTSGAFEVLDGLFMGMPVTDFVYDAMRQKIQAAVSGSAVTNGQSVVAIDPVTGAISNPIFLGNNPGKMAMSTDNQYLYVAQTTTGGVARANLSLGTVDLRFAVGTGTSVPYEMAVPPGDPQALVGWISLSQGMALFRNGVKGAATIGPSPYNNDPYSIIFHESPTNFYSISGAGYGLGSVNIVTNGLNLVRNVLGYGAHYIFEGGLIFSSSGDVYDPLNFRRLGAYATNGLVAANANLGQVYFLSGNILQILDIATFAPLGQIILPNAMEAATKLVSCGTNGVACGTATQLFVIRSEIMRPSMTADLSVMQSTSASTAVVGSNFTYSVTVSNAGPGAVTNVVMFDILPADAVLVSASNSRGLCTLTNGILNCPLGALDPQTAVTTTLTIESRTPGTLVNTARVLRDGNNLGNSISRATNTAVFSSVLPAVTRLWFNAGNLAYDSVRNNLWASVERFGGATEYSLRSINLSNGLPQSALLIDSQVGKMVVSSNSAYLYAAYSSNQKIRRANLVSNSFDLNFPVVDHIGQQHAVFDMTVMPSNPAALAVSRLGPQRDVAIYENGIQTKRSPVDIETRYLQPSPISPTRLFGLNQQDYGNSILIQFEVTATNITHISGTPGLIGGLFTEIRPEGNLLYATSGNVVDPQTLTIVDVLPARGMVQPDSSSGLVFYLVQTSSQYVLLAFHLVTFTPAWSFVIPGVTGAPANLTKCGSGVLAFTTSDDQLFILNTTQMPHELVSDLGVSQTISPVSAVTNTPVTFTITVTNSGSAPATDVMLTNQLPIDAIVLGISASQGTWTNLSNNIVGNLGDMHVGAIASMQVVVSLNHSGVMTNSASVSQFTPDPIATNNSASATVSFNTIPVSDLSVLQFLPASSIGSSFIYTLVASNAGPDTVTNLQLNAGIVSGASIVSMSASQGTASQSGGNISADFGIVSNGMAASITLMLSPMAGLFQVNASVSGPHQDPNLLNNESFNVISLASSNSENLVIEAPFRLSDIAYDPSTDHIFASTTETAGPYLNSVITVEPTNLALLNQILISNSLGRLAVSDNGQYAYVGISDTGGVARVNIPSNIVDLRFALNTPSAPFGPYRVEDLTVMPGAPGTLAVARGGYGGYLSAVALFDSGVQRPAVLDNAIQNASYFRLQFATPTNLYTTAPYGFQGASITPDGLVTNGPLFSHVGDFVLDHGLVFLNNGNVVDPTTGNVVTNFPATGIVAPDLANGKVYFLTSVNGGGYSYQYLRVKAFDAITHSELWTIPFNYFVGYEKRLIKVGSHGVAVLTDAGRMFVVRPSLLSDRTSDVSISQTASPNSATIGAGLTYTLTVANAGPWTASNVIVSNPVPNGVDFVSATSTQGNCIFTNGAVTCVAGSMTNGSIVTMRVNVTPIALGSITNVASVTQAEADPAPANNIAVLVSTNQAQPLVSVRDATAIQSSNQASIAFTLNLTAPSSTNVFVRYQTSDGTAVAGSEYDAAAGVVTFNPGITNVVLNLPIIRSNISYRTVNYFYLNLTGVTNASLLRTPAIGTIVARFFPKVSINNTNVVEGNGVTNAVFRFTLSSTGSVPVSVEYETIGLTAAAGSDYLSRVGTLVFPAGSSNASISVPVLGDTLVESNETFAVLLSQPENAILGVNEALGTIIDDEFMGPLRIDLQLLETNVWLRFNTIQGRSYRIESSDNLMPQSWVPVGDVSGTGDSVVVPVPSASSSATFYRAMLLP